VPIPRRAARVVLLDPDERVLLFRLVNPRIGSVWWATPGGGLNEGESLEAAAARELREETGLAEVELGPALWLNQRYFRSDGRVYHQDEVFFLARTEPFEVDMGGLDHLEVQSMVDFRWWTLEDLRTTAERVYPRGLGDLLTRVLREGAPEEPTRIRG
jgi:ADP-ribose pyrophosphatase YjhB (NUDIX family)